MPSKYQQAVAAMLSSIGDDYDQDLMRSHLQIQLTFDWLESCDDKQLADFNPFETTESFAYFVGDDNESDIAYDDLREIINAEYVDRLNALERRIVSAQTPDAQPDMFTDRDTSIRVVG